MRTFVAVCIPVLLASCAGPGPDLPPAGPAEIVDLTHPVDAQTIYWPTEPLFEHSLYTEGMTDKGYWYASGRFASAEHGGTHIDAPYHFWKEGETVDAVPLERLMGPGVLVDVSEACARDRDYLVSIDDLAGWESRNGRIPEGAIVLLRTGFGSYYPDRERYMGTAELGPDAVRDLHFPGLDPEAARWIATQRSIGAIGLDTPSIDHGPSPTFDSHVALFEHGVPALENVANLDQLPETGFEVIALPMKIRGGTGGPLRVIAVK